MKVGFDAKRYFHNFSGLGNYSRQLISDLSRYQSNIEIVLFNVKKVSSNFRVFHKSKINPLWRSIGIGKSVKNSGVNLFHGLSNEIPLDIPKNTGKIVTIHDVIYKEFPNYYPKIDREIYHLKTKWSLKVADKIIVTSNTTRDNILKYYSVDESKLLTVYQAVDPALYEIKKTNSGEVGQYFFYHSTFNHRKNHINLVRAFGLTCKQHNWNLVLCGAKGNAFEETIKEIENLGLESRVAVKTNVKNEELFQLLANSSCFVYPSFQEGFGIPLMEAAVLNLPMIVSDIQIFRELTNNSGNYFNPNSTHELSKWMLQISSNVNDYKQDYSEILKKINPQFISNQLYNIYSELL
jgi:glycosyltransferase involved in cell wall biosynthesis